MQKTIVCSLLLGLCFALLSACEKPISKDEIPTSKALISQDELARVFPSTLSVQTREVYIPIYSNLLYFDDNHQIPLQASVSLRNTDRNQVLKITDITYYNTNGDKVRSYLKTPVGIMPFASHEIYIGTRDLKGGSGAKFLISWTASVDISPPLFEVIFMARRGNSEFAFASRGVEIRKSRRATKQN